MSKQPYRPWPLKAQLAHDKVNPLKAGTMDVDRYGRPFVFYTYGKDNGSTEEHAAEVDIKKVVEDGNESLIYLGLQILCPKCSAPLYIKDPSMPGGKNAIHVHWDKMTKSTVDGMVRPLVTVDGTFKCDYSDRDWSGQKSTEGSAVHLPCGWEGGIYMGKMMDHTPQKIVIVR